MQIQVGQTRDVALWGGQNLDVASNNPNVVPNNGFASRMDGDTKLLTLSGARIGTSMLTAGVGDNVWVTLQVQVTADGKPLAALHDDVTFFVKPSWSSSFAGASVTADQRLWRQELDLGGGATVGLKGWQDVTLDFNQTNIASYSTFPDKFNDLLGIDLVGLRPGDVEFTAYRAGLPVASMQVFVRATASPKAYYVDNFMTGYYDIDFRSQGGNYSKYLIVRYPDEVVLPIHMDLIGDARPDPAAAKAFIDAATMGEGARRYPSQMNAGTTPNLYALKKSAIRTMDAYTYQLMTVSMEAVIFILSMVDIARGMIGSMPKMARDAAPAPVKRVLGDAPAGAEEIRMSADEYRAALSKVFPGQALNEVSSMVDGIGERAAQRAAADPRFVALYQGGNMRDAGTLFHSAAAQEARSLPQNAVPSGWRLSAERTIQAGRGGSRADIFLEGPTGEIVEFDWKTSGASALTSKTVSQMSRHAGQITTNVAGTLTTQESRSWVDFIRPLLGAPR
jgi:hypothetical protein